MLGSLASANTTTANAASSQDHGVLFSHAPLSSPNGESYGGNLYVWTPGHVPRSLTSDTDPRDQAQWSPNGNEIAFTMSPSWNGQGSVSDAPTIEVFTTRSDGDNALQLSKDGETGGPAPGADATSGPIWSPNGRQILFAREFADRPGQMVVVSALGGTETTLHPVSRGSDGAYWWQPNGIGYVVYTADNSSPSHQAAPSRLELLNPNTGRSKTLARVNLAGKQILTAVWSAKTRRVAMIVQTINSGETSITTYSEAGRKLASFRTLVPKPHWQACGLSWSPDGTQFVVAFYPGRLPYPARYYETYEVRTNGTHWKRLPVNPSTCSVSWH
ncbi:MAG TPA: hypothetical protein VFB39_13430 [Solirubrobacteraceae bacterium]|nr:hypothetical protein [Solirubrobacteraceae bacterium]